MSGEAGEAGVCEVTGEEGFGEVTLHEEDVSLGVFFWARVAYDFLVITVFFETTVFLVLSET